MENKVQPPTTAPAFKYRTGQPNRNLAPGFYYHTSSKEPVAVVKNLGNESPVKEQYKVPRRYNPNDGVVSAERTTKAGTAVASTRQAES